MSDASFTLEQYEIHPRTIIRNATPPELYEEALAYEPDASISSTGASPTTKFAVHEISEASFPLAKTLTVLT